MAMYVNHKVRTPGPKEARRTVRTPDFWEPEVKKVPPHMAEKPAQQQHPVRQAGDKKGTR